MFMIHHAIIYFIPIVFPHSYIHNSVSINTENTEITSNELNYFLFTFIKVLKLAKFVFID